MADGEAKMNPEQWVRGMLHYIGEDPDREGLADTPRRVLKAWGEMTAGMFEDPIGVLGTVFHEQYDEMVIVTDLPFVSLCEHHVLPFTGTATIGYVPNGKVVGLSKLGRCLDVLSRRLQVQERLTVQVAAAINDALDPLGVGVVLEAQHSCMACRGVRKPGRMVTSALLGTMRDEAECRAEFLALARVRMP